MLFNIDHVYTTVLQKLSQWNSSDIQTLLAEAQAWGTEVYASLIAYWTSVYVYLTEQAQFAELYESLVALFTSTYSYLREEVRISEMYELIITFWSGIFASLMKQPWFAEIFNKLAEIFTNVYSTYLEDKAETFKEFWTSVYEYWTTYDYSQMATSEYVYWAYSIYQATWASVFRLNCAAFLAPGASKEKQPSHPIILYEFEGCSYCKLVREAACVLGLDVMFKPCPKNGTIFRNELKKRNNGKVELPYLVDETKAVEMSGYRDIIKYLFDTYGEGLPKRLTLNRMIPFRMMHNCPIYSNSIFVSSFIRSTIGYGRNVLPSRRPRKPLTLWGNEHSPFVTLVRELLCSFEIPYTLINAPIGCDWKRDEYRKQYSHLLSTPRNMVPHMIQIPLLIDPNTDTTMIESRAICDYLWKTYSSKAKAA